MVMTRHEQDINSVDNLKLWNPRVTTIEAMPAEPMDAHIWRTIGVARRMRWSSRASQAARFCGGGKYVITTSFQQRAHGTGAFFVYGNSW
jgi:hypothetical protein